MNDWGIQTRVGHEDLKVGTLYDVDLNGSVDGYFSSTLQEIVPEDRNREVDGYIEFANGVHLDDYSKCVFWRTEDR